MRSTASLIFGLSFTLLSGCGAATSTHHSAQPTTPVATPADGSSTPPPAAAPGDPAPVAIPKAADPTLPMTIGALGDSITAAFDAEAFLQESPGLSWSTGDAVDATNASHYARFHNDLKVASLKAFNKAVTGATAAGLADQVDELVSVEGGTPRYVTILIGANDVCGWPADDSAALATYKERLHDAVARLVATEPDVHVALVGTPDLGRLYTLKKADARCRSIWDAAALCPQLLSSGASDADRQAFQQRWAAMNAVLPVVAAAFPKNARVTGDVDAAAFTDAQVSAIDCFHPSPAGHKLISDHAWDAAFARAALP